MTIATIRIVRNPRQALREAGSGIATAVRSGGDASAHFVFSSAEQLFRAISPKRWELIERLQSLGPSSVRGLARALDRDVKRVHQDVTGLLELGLIERDGEGAVFVPFDHIHIDCDLKAVA